MNPEAQQTFDDEHSKSALTIRLIEQKIAEASARHHEPLTLRLNLTAIAAWLVVGLVSLTCWFAVGWKHDQEASNKSIAGTLEAFMRTTGERTVRLEVQTEHHERRISKTEMDTSQLLRILPAVGAGHKTVTAQ